MPAASDQGESIVALFSVSVLEAGSNVTVPLITSRKPPEAEMLV